VAIRNPETWSRLRVNSLRELANQVGNQAMKHVKHWPQSGEGRAIKASTEVVARRLDGVHRVGDLAQVMDHLLFAAAEFRTILQNSFFAERIANEKVWGRHGFVGPAREVIASAVSEVEGYIAAYKAALPPPPTPLEQAQKIIPDQKLGPVRFRFIDGTLVVDHQPAKPDRADAAAAAAARAELLSSGKVLRDALVKTNVDPRLLDVLEDIQGRLEAKQDIIQLGIAAISCQMAIESYAMELAEVQVGQARAYAINLGMYVAQFPEWRRFSENAAVADYNAADVAKLYESGRQMVERLRRERTSVDPEVPRTLAFLLEAIRDPSRAVKQTVFSAIRTIENLLSAIFRQCGKIAIAVPDGLAEGVKVAAKYTVATALLLTAAQMATEISPAAGRILQTNWIGHAGKLILKELDK
jgi:hypothetical protein